ncbi:DUF4124 domain-containing protein [Pseudoxanthomonas beigongshangi]
MVRTIGFLFLFAVGGAQAQQLHKCVDARGHTSYQSDPCDAGQREIWVRDATPEPPPTYEQQRAAQIRQRRQEAESADLRRMAGTNWASVRSGSGVGVSLPAYSGKNPDACQAAKHQREATLKAAGMNRNFSLLRKLDDMVWKACN